MANRYHICTYFDFSFLSRGLALYYSVKRKTDNFVFYVLAFDNATENYLEKLNLENLRVISSEAYNSYFNINPDKFSERKQYFFSATPNLCLYLLENFSEIEILLYLDADVYAFNSLNSLYEEVCNADIAICSHRFHPLFRMISKNYGIYNVGVNLFRRSENGYKCLFDWQKDCNTWYPGKPGYPLSFFSDQIFLDEWNDKYKGVKVIANKGIDTAPWNIANYKISKRGDSYYIDDDPLVLFHFSALKKVAESTWNGNTIYFFGSIKSALQGIYKEYISEIESFGLDNSTISLLKHKDSFLKRSYYFFAKHILNEHVIVK